MINDLFFYNFFTENFKVKKFHKNLIIALFSHLYKNVGKDWENPQNLPENLSKII